MGQVASEPVGTYAADGHDDVDPHSLLLTAEATGFGTFTTKARGIGRQSPYLKLPRSPLEALLAIPPGLHNASSAESRHLPFAYVLHPTTSDTSWMGAALLYETSLHGISHSHISLSLPFATAPSSLASMCTPHALSAVAPPPLPRYLAVPLSLTNAPRVAAAALSAPDARTRSTSSPQLGITFVHDVDVGEGRRATVMGLRGVLAGITSAAVAAPRVRRAGTRQWGLSAEADTANARDACEAACAPAAVDDADDSDNAERESALGTLWLVVGASAPHTADESPVLSPIPPCTAPSDDSSSDKDAAVRPSGPHAAAAHPTRSPHASLSGRVTRPLLAPRGAAPARPPPISCLLSPAATRSVATVASADLRIMARALSAAAARVSSAAQSGAAATGVAALPVIPTTGARTASSASTVVSSESAGALHVGAPHRTAGGPSGLPHATPSAPRPLATYGTADAAGAGRRIPPPPHRPHGVALVAAPAAAAALCDALWGCGGCTCSEAAKVPRGACAVHGAAAAPTSYALVGITAADVAASHAIAASVLRATQPLAASRRGRRREPSVGANGTIAAASDSARGSGGRRPASDPVGARATRSLTSTTVAAVVGDGLARALAAAAGEALDDADSDHDGAAGACGAPPRARAPSEDGIGGVVVAAAARALAEDAAIGAWRGDFGGVGSTGAVTVGALGGTGGRRGACAVCGACHVDVYDGIGGGGVEPEGSGGGGWECDSYVAMPWWGSEGGPSMRRRTSERYIYT